MFVLSASDEKAQEFSPFRIQMNNSTYYNSTSGNNISTTNIVIEYCDLNGSFTLAGFLETREQTILLILYTLIFFLGCIFALSNLAFVIIRRKQLGLSSLHANILIFGSLCTVLNWVGWVSVTMSPFIPCDNWTHNTNSGVNFASVGEFIADEAYYVSFATYWYAIFYR